MLVEFCNYLLHNIPCSIIRRPLTIIAKKIVLASKNLKKVIAYDINYKSESLLQAGPSMYVFNERVWFFFRSEAYKSNNDAVWLTIHLQLSNVLASYGISHIHTLDLLFCQIATFIKVCVAFVFWLQTL